LNRNRSPLKSWRMFLLLFLFLFLFSIHF
jgi:hypothetical protein